jgi:hypothetical protein
VRVDVVGERVDRLDVGVVPLHRHLDAALVVLGVGLEVDDVLVNRVLGRVHMRDEVLDPVLVVELVRDLTLALVGEEDPQAAGQERRLAEVLQQRLDREIEAVGEDLGVGQEGDPRPRVVGGDLAGDLHRALRLAPCELLAVDLAVAVNFGDQPLRERVDDRDAYAVQAAGDLVPLAAELAAGVELGQHDGQGRQTLLGHDVDGDARAPVAHGHGVVGVDGDLDPVVATRESLVDRVVHSLVDEVVEPARARRADVHARPQPDRLEPLEDGDVFCGIGGFSH